MGYILGVCLIGGIVDMRSILENLYNKFWSEASWLRAGGYTGAAAAGIFFANSRVPSEVAIDLTRADVQIGVVFAVVAGYFFLVAILSSEQLRLVKKLRQAEQGFKYDKRGTLYNGHEPNISFRIVTFKGILEGVSSLIPKREVEAALVDTGRLASVDFAENLPTIYNADVRGSSSGSSWDRLSFDEKVHQWTDYDSATGWGVMTARLNDDSAVVSVAHLRRLFTGEGGTLFGFFLAGYAETVMSKLISKHKKGKYSDYSRVKLVSVNTKGDNMVEFTMNFE